MISLKKLVALLDANILRMHHLDHTDSKDDEQDSLAYASLPKTLGSSCDHDNSSESTTQCQESSSAGLENTFAELIYSNCPATIIIQQIE